jgi:hypothetical protein
MNSSSGFLLTCAAILSAGCPREAAPPTPPPAEPRPSVTLRLLVVNEPELAKAVGRLRGEWAERSGGELDVTASPWQELAADRAIEADVIVFPSRYLGELCVRDVLRPVRSNVLESGELDADDFFPLIRHELINWGGQAMALPLGVERAAIDEKAARSPAVWLLARAAPDAISKDKLGVLFDSESMRPRITEQPFIDALTQLVQSGTDDVRGNPAGTRDVPVLGYADRLIAATQSSRNAASAFKLVEWLAQRDISSQFARAGDGPMPVRRSLASSPLWYDESVAANERAELGDALVAALDRSECLMIPRIPAADEYLAALNAPVEDTTRGGAAPADALAKAAQEWERITDAHGRDSQRQAYLKHLGISEP